MAPAHAVPPDSAAGDTVAEIGHKKLADKLLNSV
jgi:hypothetical protein